MPHQSVLDITTFEVTLTGAETYTRSFSGKQPSINITVPPGLYEISVKAKHGNVEYAGSDPITKDIKPGQNDSVAVNMIYIREEGVTPEEISVARGQSVQFTAAVYDSRVVDEWNLLITPSPPVDMISSSSNGNILTATITIPENQPIGEMNVSFIYTYTIGGVSDNSSMLASVNVYDPTPYTISTGVNQAGYGTVTASINGTPVVSGTTTATAGTEITVTASPAAGYRFVSFNLGYDQEQHPPFATTSPATFAMPASDVTVTANFEAIPTYTVTLTQGTGYTLTAQAGSTSPVAEGGSFTFVLALETAYNQSTPTVKVNGNAFATTIGVHTITNITANQTVTVEGVKINEYTVTFKDGDVTIGTDTVTHGGTATAPAYNPPNKTSGYLVIYDGWDKALTNITAETTINAKWIPYELGDTGPGGGKIFYRSETGFDFYTGTIAADNTTEKRYYLEAATANVGNRKWSNTNINVTGTATAIGTGGKNTALIVAVHTADDASNNAAKACDEYSTDTASDWFLPSKDESGWLYTNRTLVGISTGYYWSSSQYADGYAWGQNFDSSGSQGNEYMGNAHPVRLVRAF